jgi:hypothetical protein
MEDAIFPVYNCTLTQYLNHATTCAVPVGRVSNVRNAVRILHRYTRRNDRVFIADIVFCNGCYFLPERNPKPYRRNKPALVVENTRGKANA